MSYPSHTIQCTHLKCAVQWFLAHVRVVQTWWQSVLKHFHHLISSHFPFFSRSCNPVQTLKYFLCLLICLFWIFHVNGIGSLLWPTLFTEYVFEVYLYCSIYQYSIPLYYRIIIGCTTFYLSIFYLIDIWVISTFLAFMNKCCYEHLCPSFYVFLFYFIYFWLGWVFVAVWAFP